MEIKDKIIVKKELENLINQAVKDLSLTESSFSVEHPNDFSHGDYSTNVAMVLAKETKKNPKELAETIVEKLNANKTDDIEKIEVAGAGFINFYLTKDFFRNSIKEIIEKGESFGKNENLKGEKVIVEYTDPNVMKPFHIGHLMSNAVGESISRLIEWNSAHVFRMNYYSDSGLNIAKAVWGVKARLEEIPKESASSSEKSNFLGSAYAFGVAQFSSNEDIEKEIIDINIKIFNRSDEEINKIYNLGKRWSLEHLDELYKRLGTKFDKAIGESEISEEGRKIVEELLKKGVFEESNGAVVFHGEKYDPKLHTRVFINNLGLPTYEAKEIGLTYKKFELYQPDISIVITANEQNDYFKVVLEALRQVNPKFAEKTKHLSHGMLRLTTGKMSSRTGNVVTAESLIDEVKEKTEGNEAVAIGAIKYMILRQSIGSDIIFDINQSVSTEGDSGVYLQYAHARASSLLDKATGIEIAYKERSVVHEVEKLLYRFPEVVERAGREYAPSHVTTYLTELASAFNNFYAHEEVIGDSPESSTRLAIVKGFKTVMKNGLDVLGIPAPEKM